MSRIILSTLGSVAISISTAAQAASQASPSPPADHELLERALDTIKAQGAEIQALQARIDQLEKDRVPTLEQERQFAAAPKKEIDRQTVAQHAEVPPDEVAAIGKACSVSPSTATYVVAAPKPFAAECLAPNRDKKGKTVLDRNWNCWDSVHMGVAFLGGKEPDARPGTTSRASSAAVSAIPSLSKISAFMKALQLSPDTFSMTAPRSA